MFSGLGQRREERSDPDFIISSGMARSHRKKGPFWFSGQVFGLVGCLISEQPRLQLGCIANESQD